MLIYNLYIKRYIFYLSETFIYLKKKKKKTDNFSPYNPSAIFFKKSTTS